MRAFTFFLIAALGLLQLAASQPCRAQGIVFESGYLPAVMAKAQTENKTVFVDVFTTWCAPCRYMDEHVFSDPGLGQYFKDHMIAVQLDAEAGEGIAFARDNKVQAYPTFFILSPEGKVLDRRSGIMEVQDLKIWTALTPAEKPATNKRMPKNKGRKRDKKVIGSE